MKSLIAIVAIFSLSATPCLSFQLRRQINAPAFVPPSPASRRHAPSSNPTRLHGVATPVKDTIEKNLGYSIPTFDLTTTEAQDIASLMSNLELDPDAVGREDPMLAGEIADKIRELVEAKTTGPYGDLPEFHQKVLSGDIASAKEMIVLGEADINEPDSLGQSALHKACNEGNMQAVQFLLPRGADLHLKDAFGFTPLHLAARNGHTAAVQALLAQIEAVSLDDVLNKAWERAAATMAPADMKKVQALLDYGVGVAARSFSEAGSNTPLHFACAEGREETVSLLLKAPGADVALKMRNENGETVLHAAAKSGNPSLTKMMVGKGGDLDSVDKFGKTPLQGAVEEGRTACVKALIDAGANTSHSDKAGNGIIHSAAGPKGTSEIMDLILKKGKVKPDAKRGTFANGWSTALHIAAAGGNMDVAKTLIGADKKLVNARDALFETPLHDAARSGNLNMIKFMLDSGADKDARGARDETALEIATRKDFARAEYLLETGEVPPVITLEEEDGTSLEVSQEDEDTGFNAEDEITDEYREALSKENDDFPDPELDMAEAFLDLKTWQNRDVTYQKEAFEFKTAADEVRAAKAK
ncbi:unnamed protein product [Vitrella brassicaformis CCMP3155]|uniref:Uncharacterized protein n=2 Tax=Vitrella brassicaformis TaxID=1169539 RepID=A0A0G4EB66_VITBC|nr:unnamed protein product [Vitrella brassicaformis CCMP3155]|eukprot:CEL92504.1 unnamed protein product [Vitrella brassicaformis CCMP3155]